MIERAPPLPRQIDKRTPYHHKSIPFVALWAQKSGCTSIFKWFLWHAGLFADALQYRAEEEGLSIHNYEMEVFKRTPGYKKKLLGRLESGAPIVNFMRCPYARAFSSYMHLHNRFYIRFERDGIPNEGLDLRYSILESIYGFRVPVEYPVTFMDYLQWLDSHDISTIEPHHAGQYTPLYDLPDVVHYRLEDFDEVASALERRFGLEDSSSMRDRFSSPHHIGKSDVDRNSLYRFLERGVSLSRSPNYLIPLVDRGALQDSAYGELIEHIFQKDIELYERL